MPVAKENPWKKKKATGKSLAKLKQQKELRDSTQPQSATTKAHKKNSFGLKKNHGLQKKKATTSFTALKVGDNVKLEWPRNGAYETIPRNFVGKIIEIRGANGEFITAKSRFDVTYDGYLPSLKVTKLKRL